MVTVQERVRFAETDMMGVVHHANYFRWFEVGRVAYLREVGISLYELMEENIVFPITHVECQYRASAKFDDVIIIEACLESLSRAKMVFTYRILREADGALLAEGRTQNVFTDMEGKIIRLSDHYYKRLQANN